MSSKKKKAPPRPMDAIREMIEDQVLQISDLTQIVKKQSEEIKILKDKFLEEETRQQKIKDESSSWFFASRTSD